MSKVTPTDILNFWFAPETKPLWYAKSDEFDKKIKEKFLDMHKEAAKGNLDSWKDESAEACLALIIALDQFPRNMFRGSPQQFATDTKAAQLTKAALAKEWENGFNDSQKLFLYLPLMHSENLDDQKLCVSEDSIRGSGVSA